VNTQVEFLARAEAYDTVCCPDCFEAAEAELHARSCWCRHCVARRAAEAAREKLAQRRAREAEHERLREAGVIVGEGENEDIGF
jgi:transposase